MQTASVMKLAGLRRGAVGLAMANAKEFGLNIKKVEGVRAESSSVVIIDDPSLMIISDPHH